MKSEVVISPKKTLFYIWLTAFLLRLIMIFLVDSRMYADEIFQSLEIAHLWAYGRGLIPPEFIKSNASSYFMIRSPIFPAIFYPFFWLGKTLGLNYRLVVLPLIKIFLAFNASLLIPASYYFTREILEEKDHARPLFVSSLMAAWLILGLFMIHPISNSFFTPALLFFIALYFKGLRKKNLRKNFLIHFTSPFFIALIVYVRLDLLVPIFAVFISRAPRIFIKEKISPGLWLLYNSIGVISAFIFGTIIDTVYYGYFISSPLRWVNYNIIENNSAKYFATYPFYFYFVVYFIGTLPNLYFLIISLKEQYNEYLSLKQNIKIALLEDRNYVLSKLELFSSFLLTFLIFSLPARKDVRFVFTGLVFMYVYFGVSLWDVIEKKAKNKPKYLEPLKIKRIVIDKENANKYFYAGVFLSIIFFYSIISLPFYGYLNNHDRVEAEKFLGEQKDVRGIVQIASNFSGCGYTIIHLDVPIYIINNISTPVLQAKARQFLMNNYSEYNYVILPTKNFDEIAFAANITVENVRQWLRDAGYFVLKTFYSYPQNPFYQEETQIWKHD